MSYEHGPHYPLHHHLPPDFRAFYPYTPNEVKHRRRTTSAQLKVLETVFRVDTKPNATLRNDLAAQLGMTARGVQVWFQNRRAKEKNKANKKSNTASSTFASNSAAASSADSTTPNLDSSLKEEDDLDAASPPATPGEELPEELLKSDSSHDIPPNQRPSSQLSSPSPAAASPPKLHVLTDALRPSSAASWKPTPPDETPPDSAVFPSRPSLPDIFSQRRPSLPANTFFHPYSTTSTRAPQSIDDWNYHDRRRSVDMGLQRLVRNPYAKIARARNVALLPQSQSSRQHSLPRKKSSLRRPFLPHQPPPNDYLDMRRASMDPLTLMPGRADGLSPSPSPFPLHHVRASLPDTSLYAASRRYVREIPAHGPLPLPGFTFGAASVGSPTDDDPPSPDFSTYSFPAKDDTTNTTEDDDVISSFSFGNLSRFGSAVSIATSESSVFSNSGFYDIGDLAPDQERRSSCGSAHHAQLPSVTPGLDGAIPPLQNPAPVTTDGYRDENSMGTVLVPGANLDPQPQADDVSPASTFSSPASTASPDGSPATQSSTPPANVSVSNTTELVSSFSVVSGNPGPPNGGPLRLNSLKPSEQQEQQPLRHSFTNQTPPPSQQQLANGHQRRAVESDPSFTLDDNPKSRITMIPGSNQPVTAALLSGANIGIQSVNEQHKSGPFSRGPSLPATSDPADGQGDYTAQYLDLMDGLNFDTPLAMLNGESATPMAGQGGQRSSGVAGCDTLARLGLDIEVGDFITNNAVTSASASFGPSPAASGITTSQPTFGIAFGS